jgi:uncharacterized membrane protein YhaH (DUF805 family)
MKGVRIEMKFKKLFSYVVVGILGILLANLIAANYLEIRGYANRFQIEKLFMGHLIGTLYCFLFGLLLEWKTIVALARREIALHISSLLILGIVVLAISCISPAIILRFGLYLPFPAGSKLLSFFIGPLSQSSNIQNILAVTAGCMILRGMTKKLDGVFWK